MLLDHNLLYRLFDYLIIINNISAYTLHPTPLFQVSVGSGDRKLTASKSVTQRVHVVADAAARWAAFVSLIEPVGPRGSHGGKRVIVFANMKSTVKKVTTYCQGRGMAVECISGDRSQSPRESTLRRFKDDVADVRNGTECGIGVRNYNDVRAGDLIEVFDTKEIARSL